MNSLPVSLIAFLVMFGGAVTGMVLARRLAAHHVSGSTQDTVKLGVGMVAAMTSLILGLMTASVKGNFDSTDKDVHTYALSLRALSSELSHGGPAACPAQTLLSGYTWAVIGETWQTVPPLPAGTGATPSGELLYQLDVFIRGWTPETEPLKEVRKASLEIMRSILSTRWTVSEEAASPVPMVFIVVLIVWLGLIFLSFGLFAPANRVVMSFFFLCSLSIAGALFLILEMSGPFDGVIAISPDTLVDTAQYIEKHACR